MNLDLIIFIFGSPVPSMAENKHPSFVPNFFFFRYRGNHRITPAAQYGAVRSCFYWLKTLYAPYNAQVTRVRVVSFERILRPRQCHISVSCALLNARIYISWEIVMLDPLQIYLLPLYFLVSIRSKKLKKNIGQNLNNSNEGELFSLALGYVNYLSTRYRETRDRLRVSTFRLYLFFSSSTREPLLSDVIVYSQLQKRFIECHIG